MNTSFMSPISRPAEGHSSAPDTRSPGSRRQVAPAGLSRRELLKQLGRVSTGSAVLGLVRRQSRGAPQRNPHAHSLVFPAAGDFAALTGFNFKPTILMQTEAFPSLVTEDPFSSRPGGVTGALQRIASLRFNQLRVGMCWESWEKYRIPFIREAVEVARAAEIAAIYIQGQPPRS